MARPEGFQRYKIDYEYEGYSYSESDSDSSSEGSPSLPPFQLPKARMDEKWLRDKRILRKTQYGISSRGHIKPTDSSSLSTIQSNISSLLESTNEEDDLSDLYTPVQKGERHRVSPVFAVPHDLSPVMGSSIDEPPSVPSLRLQRDWRPQQTSTSTSFQPFVSTLPKTNPHHGPKFVSSTPRASTASRIPMYSYNQIIEGVSRPSSYYGEDSCEFPSSARSHVENVKPTFYRPENFGLPTGVAKNVGSEGIIFLSMTLCGNQLNVTINEAVYFQDPYQPQISSYVRVEMRRRCGNSRKRYYREKIQSYKTRNWPATNRPAFNEKFTFYIDEDNYFRDLLTISVYKLKADNHQQRMRMLGCMTFPVKRLMKKAREAVSYTHGHFEFHYSRAHYVDCVGGTLPTAVSGVLTTTALDYLTVIVIMARRGEFQNDGYYIDENMTMDEVVVNEGGFFLLSPKRGEKKSFPQNKISIKTYYNDKTFSGDGVLTTTSSSCISNPSEMPPRTQRSSVPGRKKTDSDNVPIRFEGSDVDHYVGGSTVAIRFERNPADSYEDGSSVPIRFERSDGIEQYAGGSSVPIRVDRTAGDYTGKSSVRIRLDRNEDKLGGIFSSLGGSIRRSHRATLPDLSTTRLSPLLMEVAAAVAEPWRRRVSSVSLDNSSVNSDLPVSPRSPNSSLGCLCEVDELDSDDPSENTSDGGASSLHVRRRTVTQDRLTPDANYNFRKKCPTPTSPSIYRRMSFQEPKKDQGVRRAASFTFSPKGAADKTNRRVHVPQEREEREDKKKLL
ncbi:C2 domain protein [Ancylostoma caninum]|uniref:C2 domain protein n=1 Tax=Ancylostoma caninum TaxID=29170 RepID=A0A368FK83_ANCCA|nr:C2 domain protein [Ancylostoma caninum]